MTSKKRLFAWIMLGLASCLLVVLFLGQREGFADGPLDEEEALKREIDDGMSFANSVLCPAFRDVVKILVGKEQANASGDDGAELDEAEANRRVLSNMNAATGNKVYLCPMPKDILKLPNDIDQYILKTSLFLGPAAKQAREDILNSMKCIKSKQAFTDYMDTDPIRFKELFEDASPTALNEKVLKEQRIAVLKLKRDAILKGIQSDAFLQLKTEYDQLADIKKRSDEGTLSPSCG